MLRLLIADLCLFLSRSLGLIGKGVHQRSGTEVVEGPLTSKVFSPKLWSPKLLAFELSVELFSFNLELSNVFSKLAIIKRATEPLHDQVSRLIIAWDFVDLIGELLSSVLVLFQFRGKRSWHVPLLRLVLQHHIFESGFHLAFNDMSFPLDVPHLLLDVVHSLLDDGWVQESFHLRRIHLPRQEGVWPCWLPACQ